MPKPLIGKAALKVIEAAVDELFDRLKVRLLGPSAVGKSIAVTYRHMFSVPGLYEQGALEEGVRPDKQTLDAILDTAGKYVEAVRLRAKAATQQAVTSFLQNAAATGVKTDVKTVLGGELSRIYADVSTHVSQIVDAEITAAKNIGALDGIIRINQSQSIDDPRIYFVVVNDNYLCKECRRLHLLDDGVTPKVWLLSEVSQGYHKRGDDRPSTNGEHPHCRCTPATLLLGYGFKDGRVAFISPRHDELEKQRR